MLQQIVIAVVGSTLVDESRDFGQIVVIRDVVSCFLSFNKTISSRDQSEIAFMVFSSQESKYRIVINCQLSSSAYRLRDLVLARYIDGLSWCHQMRCGSSLRYVYFVLAYVNMSVSASPPNQFVV